MLDEGGEFVLSFFPPDVQDWVSSLGGNKQSERRTVSGKRKTFLVMERTRLNFRTLKAPGRSLGWRCAWE